MELRLIIISLLLLMSITLIAQTPSIVLDGANDYVGSYGDILDMGLSDWSFQLWFKTTDATGGLVGKTVYGSVPGRWGIFFSSGNPGVLRILIQGSSSNVQMDALPQQPGSVLWNDGNWHQATVTCDRDGLLSLYMDGVFNNSTSMASLASNNLNFPGYFFIGAYGNSSGTGPQDNFYINGSIDEVRVWNKVLSPAEITANFNVEIDYPQSNLVGYWQMNEDTGNIIYDLSGNSYDGTLYGGITWGDGPVTLPVELSSFTATISSQYYVELHWITESETSALGYMIYRSENDRLEHALQVSPLIDATNTTTQVAYHYTDYEVSPGTWYYWLQSMDMDGRSEYHGPVMAIVNADQGAEAPELPLSTGISRVFPNPFNPNVHIQYTLKESAPTRFYIYNARGQAVQSYSFDSREPGSYNLNWDATGMASGVYIIRMHCGNSIFTSKAVLSK